MFRKEGQFKQRRITDEEKNVQRTKSVHVNDKLLMLQVSIDFLHYRVDPIV